MNRTTLRLLGFIVAVLVAALLLIEAGDDSELPGAGALLFPEMRAVANDIDHIAVTRAGNTLVIERLDGAWVVPERGNYAANTGIITEVLLAMTEAAVVEPKTANPELHDRLGVDAPETETNKGTAVAATAGESTFELIFGNVAQQDFRYARVAGEDQSWLIDQNPDIPTEPGDWLDTDIVDIDSNRIRSVSIEHPDGDIISISKEAEGDVNFTVANIPEGRELSYSTVANGIGGALNDLDLDDVRSRSEVTDPVRTHFETFDGVRVDVEVSEDDIGNWIAFDIEIPTDADAETLEEWNATKARVDGWAYRIADYKANLLTRQWEDILREEEEADGE